MSFKEDALFLADWNKKMKIKSDEHEINGAYAENCEYADVCKCAKIRCIDKNRYDCGDWHAWKHVDLERIFKNI
jgi:hypothetical protein